jgi:hypothetical protein
MALRHPPKMLGEVAAVNLLGRAENRGMLAQLRATREGAEAVTAIACLALAAVHGAGAADWPTQYEYAEHWGINLRRAEREWALVRLAFPGERGPDRIARLLMLDYRSRLEEAGAAAAFSVPYSGAFAIAA